MVAVCSGELDNNRHIPRLATGTAKNIYAGQPEHHFPGGEFGSFSEAGRLPQALTDKRDGMLFGDIGEEAEVTDPHKAVRQDVEEKAPDELIGRQCHHLLL